ncbi:hypothetical protein [Nodularia sp. LEGE 04288]|uniref:hypothetical protein n=1 Tax=Nodularia sp. LEGE 04288 TaxID=1828639 RepID=UPI001D108913|nr:hypothetical protein [Nodularia sp. LEGE 04288]MCC2695225.1 hypothetical protein [Nodularia sp. LEGE 04288]
MTKPLGYYCAVTPGDESFLDELQNEYGSTLEKLTTLQKLHILNALILNCINAQTQLIGTIPADEELAAMSNTVEAIRQRLPIGEHLGLADAIINQLK